MARYIRTKLLTHKGRQQSTRPQMTMHQETSKSTPNSVDKNQQSVRNYLIAIHTYVHHLQSMQYRDSCRRAGINLYIHSGQEAVYQHQKSFRGRLSQLHTEVLWDYKTTVTQPACNPDTQGEHLSTLRCTRYYALTSPPLSERFNLVVITAIMVGARISLCQCSARSLPKPHTHTPKHSRW